MRPQRPDVVAALVRRASARVVLGLGFFVLSCSLVHQDPPNESPVVQVREADTTRVNRGGKVGLRVTASDEDDDPLTYLWLADGGSFADSTDNATEWIAPTEIFGSSEIFLVTVIVQDNQLETQDPVETFLIEVVQRPPVWVAVPEAQSTTTGDTLVLWALADDEDGDGLTYEWRLHGGVTSSADVRSHVLVTDDEGDTLSIWRAVGNGSHHDDSTGAVWIRQQRSSGEDDTVRVEVIPVAAASHTVELSVTDAIDEPTETISARFEVLVEAAADSGVVTEAEPDP
jgi:hypothetical protein